MHLARLLLLISNCTDSYAQPATGARDPSEPDGKNVLQILNCGGFQFRKFKVDGAMPRYYLRNKIKLSVSMHTVLQTPHEVRGEPGTGTMYGPRRKYI